MQNTYKGFNIKLLGKLHLHPETEFYHRHDWIHTVTVILPVLCVDIIAPSMVVISKSTL